MVCKRRDSQYFIPVGTAAAAAGGAPPGRPINCAHRSDIRPGTGAVKTGGQGVGWVGGGVDQIKDRVGGVWVGVLIRLGTGDRDRDRGYGDRGLWG